MAQIEIDLANEEAVAFDRVFWRFVTAEMEDLSDPDVRLDAFRTGLGERRVVTFGDRYQAEAFERHWRLAFEPHTESALQP
jgi:hypothetical protein